MRVNRFNQFIFYNCTAIFIALQNLNFIVVSSEQLKILCPSFPSVGGLFPNCTISLQYKDVEDRGLEGCRKAGDRNLLVTLNELIGQVTFECESEQPLDVIIDSEYDTPIVHYTNARRERIAPIYHDNSTYRYILAVDIPTAPLIFGHSTRTTLVKYHVYQMGQREIFLNVLFYILYDNWSLEENERVHWMQASSTLEAKKEIVTIPALTLAPRLYLYRVTDNWISPLNDASYYYDHSVGVILDSNLLSHSVKSEYVCDTNKDLHKTQRNETDLLPPDWEEIFPTAKHFSIIFPINFTVKPYFNLIEKDAFYDAQHKQKPFKLSCSRVSQNVTIAIHRWERESGNIKVIITNDFVSKPMPRYSSTATLNFHSQDECKRDTVHSKNCAYDTVHIECRDAKTHERLHLWTLKTHMFISDDEYFERPTSAIRYDKLEDNFLCEPLDPVNEVSIQQLQCKNVFQCNQFDKCITYADHDEEHQLKHKLCINSVTTFALTPCKNTQIRPPPNALNSTYIWKPCAVAKPLVSSRGILQCLAKGNNTNDLYQETYFRGFDGELYSKSRDYDVNAVVQIRAMDPADVYYTLGTFRFRCEAHSFFFEDGLVWLFYSPEDNGELKQIPEDQIKHIPLSDSDLNENSKSIVDITFMDSSVTKVFCAAPRVFSKALWNFGSLDVRVEECIAPNITKEDEKVKFKEGEITQSLMCRADGIPRPKFQWYFNGNEIVDNVYDHVISTVLMFPQFHATMEGVYTCNATNLKGNDIRSFHVTVDDEPDYNNIVFYTVITTVGILAIVIIATLSIIIHRKKQRVVQEESQRQLKSIAELLHGTVEKGSEEWNNAGEELQDPAIQLPYDKSYELERNSFYIDKNRLLGKGNYGLVYKGNIEGLEGHCAFKMLKPEASICELRTLVYELKILSYIGLHRNVVQLKGAYTRDILKGELCLATELCALGSMEEYLRTNRDFFVNHINKFNSKDNLNNPEHSSICSFTRLLIWCSQIACAMEYLEIKKVVHADLAARNILLTADAVAKLNDFGLSRRTFTDYKYIRTGDEGLAWQWMAVESVKSNIYSYKSDIWSYGITMWEIFSLGAIPYPGVQPPPRENPSDVLTFWNNLVDQLENGLKNSKPKFASEKIYEIMKSCWEVDSKLRPSFTALQSSLQLVIDNWEIHAAQVSSKHKIVIEEQTRYQPEAEKSRYVKAPYALQKRRLQPPSYVPPVTQSKC